MERPRLIRRVDDETWHTFTALARLRGQTLAQYFRDLVATAWERERAKPKGESDDNDGKEEVEDGSSD